MNAQKKPKQKKSALDGKRLNAFAMDGQFASGFRAAISWMLGDPEASADARVKELLP